jgi:hypothetical protein
MTALDTMDFWVGTVGIFLFATVQIVTLGRIRIPKVYRFSIRYVSPAYLLGVFVGFCFQNLGSYLEAAFKNPVARYRLIWRAFVSLGLVLLTVSAGRRWRKLGLDSDGQNDNLEGSLAMTLLGWIFMLSSLAFVLWLCVVGYARLLRKPKPRR